MQGQLSAAVRSVEASRVATDGTEARAETVTVVRESPLSIEVEAYDSYTILCTPIDLRALALGFLLSEGIIESMQEIAEIRACETDSSVLRVRLARGLEGSGLDTGRNLLISSSCGACGTEDLHTRLAALPAVGNALRIETSALRQIAKRTRERQTLFEASGGTHAAGIFDGRGQIVAIGEDTGRHNALDKALGTCLEAGTPIAGCGVFLSGRVSMEMAGKCARAGIELVAAVSAPTSLAIDVAERAGMTLCAFVRETRATVFTHPLRLL